MKNTTDFNYKVFERNFERNEGIFDFFKFKDIVSMLCGIFGFISIIYAVNHEFITSLVFLIAAAVADVLDGKIARKFSKPNEYGRYIDTVNDVVAFGVAPGAFIYFYEPNIFSFILAVVVLSCGLMRLARYLCIESVKTDKTTDKTDYYVDYYVGLPITFNGIIIPLMYTLSEISNFNLFFLVLLSSILMISKIKFKKNQT